MYPIEKLSIYPEPEREIVVVDTPSVLETQLGVARTAVTKAGREVHARVHGVVSKWIGVEHAERVKALVAPDEPLTPALLYVGVASLSGSILARNRAVFARILLPPTFFLLSFKYFLPNTAHNVSAYAGSLEEEHFPSLARKHAIAIAHSHMAWDRLREAGISGRDKVQDGLGSTVRKVQELTGLKVQDALGGGATTSSKGAEKAEEALQPVRDAAAEAGQPGEKTAEEKGAEGRTKV
ncbi:apolipo protein O-domain-containing protein [Russula earlei]|uniref:Apolipo protein O-domain-containing protein n=1 Tax=Russula earlei TaxID=71964 RepID=A0ACC0UL68_9AGAM|nr:apolipo protein O-domain-containing protein [Russula earlei]